MQHNSCRILLWTLQLSGCTRNCRKLVDCHPPSSSAQSYLNCFRRPQGRHGVVTCLYRTSCSHTAGQPSFCGLPECLASQPQSACADSLASKSVGECRGRPAGRRDDMSTLSHSALRMACPCAQVSCAQTCRLSLIWHTKVQLLRNPGAPWPLLKCGRQEPLLAWLPVKHRFSPPALVVRFSADLPKSAACAPQVNLHYNCYLPYPVCLPLCLAHASTLIKPCGGFGLRKPILAS